MRANAKYMIIEDYIRGQIDSGHFKVGDQIPTEYKLSAQFGIGRLTVNKAMINLAKDGYIRRFAGKGSFVIPRTLARGVDNPHSFTSDMAEIGLKATSRLLEYRLVAADDNLARILELSTGEPVHYFTRLRLGDDRPYAISYTYIPYRIIPEFDPAVLEGSLNAFLEGHGLKEKNSRLKVTATVADEQQRQLLELNDQPLLKSALIRYDKKAVPYEYTEMAYRADKVIYIYNFGIKAKL